MEVMMASRFLYLTTVGRRSALPREIEIWFGELRGKFYLIAEHRGRAHWVRNIIENPSVQFRVAASHHIGQARIVDPKQDAELEERVRVLFNEKYGWCNGLIVELTPTG
jgi:deazaflavin-dependent oxidoreductase (nitroreductase family)